MNSSSEVTEIGLSALPPFSVQEIRKRACAVLAVMKEVMRENTHYGTLPGSRKPSLWKAGAEVLCLTFRLAPLLESRVVHDDPGSEWTYHQITRDGVFEGTTLGYFEVEAFCTIQTLDGQILSRCSARCSNREGKYRELGLFEVRNTVQKMSEKRAFVSAVLMATGASDLFTQDLEDLPGLVDPLLRRPVLFPPPAPPTQLAGKGLTPKREAWLFRAAHEANLPEEAMDSCLEHLRHAAPEVVRAFFDDLAHRKKVFAPFLAKVS